MVEIANRPGQGAAAGTKNNLTASIVAQSVKYDNIPLEMRARPQWVAWRADKVPMNPHTGKMAASDDLMTWGTFAQAVEGARKYGLAGIGFVFCSGDPFVGIDFDDVEGDDLPDEVKALDSWTERSPSGHGYHVIVRGKLKDSVKRTEIEMYSSGRYFTMTGDHVAGTPTTIEPRQEQIDELVKRYKPEKPTPTPRPAPLEHLATLGDDAALIEKARSAKNGAKFDALWRGDTSLHGGDDSAADAALCEMLAFWTNKDAGRIESLFRQSGLYRDKWDRADYRERTIAYAIENCPNVYDPVDASDIVPLSVGGHLYGETRGPMSQDATLPDCANCGLVAAVDQLKAELAAVRRQLAVLGDERLKLLAVQRNGAIKAERNVALAAIFEVGSAISRGVDQGGLVKVNRGVLAERAGVSPSTVSKHMQSLEDWGIIERQHRTGFKDYTDYDTGEIKSTALSEVWVRLKAPIPETLDRLATYKPERAAWGGSRDRCPKHPDADIIVTTTRTCAECGELLGETFRVEKLDRPEEQDATPETQTRDATHRDYSTHEGKSETSGQSACSFCGEPGRYQVGEWRLCDKPSCWEAVGVPG
jgi:putative DNA primase/helicase